MSAKTKKTNFIFITGGVVSSLGKGVSAAAIASLLQAHGYKTRIRKLDPYLNIDPGTMSPYEHGEVFVTDDGAETDLDLGHYERFTNVTATKNDTITTGQIYTKLLSEERQGKTLLGRTMQIVPHVTNAIKDFISAELQDEDFLFCEIGGTVGDIESLPFLEAIRQFRFDLGRDRVFHIHMTLLPYLRAAAEFKTKPTQHSVKELLSLGIQPDMLICRAESSFPDKEREKIAQFCNVAKQDVIPAPDLESIYEIPLHYREQKIDLRILKHFEMKTKKTKPKEAEERWRGIISTVKEPLATVAITIVGKYTDYKDSYMSLVEALRHGGIANSVDIDISWLEAETLEVEKFPTELFANSCGIIIPGGFGKRGSQGKIDTITFAREKKIPFLGICFGMQLAVIEYARNVLGDEAATTIEFAKRRSNGNGANGADNGANGVSNGSNYYVVRMPNWFNGGQLERRLANGGLGGSMRLGAYPCHLKKDTLAYDIYQKESISERHRHRFEINNDYCQNLEQQGMRFSGFFLSPASRRQDEIKKSETLTNDTLFPIYECKRNESEIDEGTRLLPEILELPDHPWFLGVQFHPELKSRPFAPHPIFAHFVAAASKHGKLV